MIDLNDDEQFALLLQPLRIPSGWTVAINIFTHFDPTPETIEYFYGSVHFVAFNLQENIALELVFEPEGDAAGTYVLVIYRLPLREAIHRHVAGIRTDVIKAMEAFMSTGEARPDPVSKTRPLNFHEVLQPLRMTHSWSVDYNMFTQFDPGPDTMKYFTGPVIFKASMEWRHHRIELRFDQLGDPLGSYLLCFYRNTVGKDGGELIHGYTLRCRNEVVKLIEGFMNVGEKAIE